MTRVALTPAQRKEVAKGRFVRVGRAMESVLVGQVDGVWTAYRNECKHRALPLDLGASSPMSDDGEYLLCHQHGALYRLGDGKCVVGPCSGESLDRVQVQIAEGADVAEGEIEIE